MLSTRFFVPAIFLAIFLVASPLSSTSISERALPGEVNRNPTVRKTRARRSNDNCGTSSTREKAPSSGQNVTLKTNPQGSIPSKKPVLSATDVVATFGQVKPDACKGKKMSYVDGQGSFDKEQLADRLTVYHNAWGAGTATKDSSQTTECQSYDAELGVISWSTSYAWTSANDSEKNQVKSYCNAAWAGKPVEIKALQVLTTVWEWHYANASSGLVSDVSYDMFTSKSATCSGQGGGCASHEIMIWLSARGGALPAGSKASTKPLTIANIYSFDVYKGEVGGIPVLSLVPTSGQEYTSFSADLISAMNDLSAYGLEPDEYILSVGAGTEPFGGTATLVTTKYSLRIS